MKLNETFSFPHPVLSESADDYVNCPIDLDVEIEERPVTGALTIRYSVSVGSSVIDQAVRDGSVKCYLSVVCREAFYNESFLLSSLVGSCEVGKGLLHGRVQLRAIFAATQSVVLDGHELNAEYEVRKTVLEEGAIVGWTEAQYVTVGMEKLAPMESIFRLSMDKSLVSGSFDVSLDQESVGIHASEALHPTIHAMRGNGLTRPVVLNAVYLHAVISALDAFKLDDDSFSGLRWHRVISAKADSMNIDIRNGSSLTQAQELLGYPSGRLTDFMQRLG